MLRSRLSSVILITTLSFPQLASAQVWGGIAEGFVRGAEFMQRKREMELEQERLRLIEEHNRQQRELLQQEAERRRAERLAIENEKKKEVDRENAAREAGSSGSGFFVSREGHVLTNAHVIESNQYVLAKDHAGDVFPLEIISINRKADLALLKANRKTEGIGFAENSSVDKGLRVFAIGFPQPKIQGVESKITDGIISSLSGIYGDEDLLQISVPIQGGNSGGPLVSEEGALVGVVVSTLNPGVYFSETGNIPQNVNFAIKLDVVRNFLLENNIKPLRAKKTSSNPLGFVDKNTILVLARPRPFDAHLPAKKTKSVDEKITASEKNNPSASDTPSELSEYQNRVKVLRERAARGEVEVEFVSATWSRLKQPVISEFVKIKESLWLPESVAERLEQDHLFTVDGEGEKAGLVIHLVNRTDRKIAYFTYHLTDSRCIEESKQSAYLAIKLSKPLTPGSERVILVPGLSKNAPQIIVGPAMCGVIQTAWSDLGSDDY